MGEAIVSLQKRRRGTWGIVKAYPSPSVLARPRGLDLGLGVEEDVRLLLESTLGLDGQLGSHLDGLVSMRESTTTTMLGEVAASRGMVREREK